MADLIGHQILRSPCDLRITKGSLLSLAATDVDLTGSVTRVAFKVGAVVSEDVTDH